MTRDELLADMIATCERSYSNHIKWVNQVRDADIPADISEAPHLPRAQWDLISSDITAVSTIDTWRALKALEAAPVLNEKASA